MGEQCNEKLCVTEKNPNLGTHNFLSEVVVAVVLPEVQHVGLVLDGHGRRNLDVGRGLQTLVLSPEPDVPPGAL